jgi:hypothetical protein
MLLVAGALRRRLRRRLKGSGGFAGRAVLGAARGLSIVLRQTLLGMLAPDGAVAPLVV